MERIFTDQELVRREKMNKIREMGIDPKLLFELYYIFLEISPENSWVPEISASHTAYCHNLVNITMNH